MDVGAGNRLDPAQPFVLWLPQLICTMKVKKTSLSILRGQTLRRQAGSLLVVVGLGLSAAILAGVSGVLYAAKKKQGEKLAEAEAQLQQMSDLRKQAVNTDADVSSAKATIDKLKEQLATSEAARRLAEKELLRIKSQMGLAEAEKTTLQAENAELKIQIQTLKIELNAAKSSSPGMAYRTPPAKKKSEQELCVSQLKRIQGAKKQWSIYEGKGNEDLPSENDIYGVVKFITKPLYCPSGGEYKLGKVGEHPTCSHAGHSY